MTPPRTYVHTDIGASQLLDAVTDDARTLPDTVKGVDWTASRLDTITEATGSRAEFDQAARAAGLSPAWEYDGRGRLSAVAVKAPATPGPAGVSVWLDAEPLTDRWQAIAAGHTLELPASVAAARVSELQADTVGRLAVAPQATPAAAHVTELAAYVDHPATLTAVR